METRLHTPVQVLIMNMLLEILSEPANLMEHSLEQLQPVVC